jgi:serine protease
MTNKRAQALVLATAIVAGYAGAAGYSTWGTDSVPVATGFGPDDGLTRYALTAVSGNASPELLAGLETVAGVVSAQRLSDGRALVATQGLAPQDLESLSGVADADFSPSVPVAGEITDPYFPTYGYNLDNTGRNSDTAAAVPGADVDAPAAWDGGTGNGRIVAVVDTGYDSDHPELAGALWTNPAETCGAVDTDGNGKAGDCHGWNFATDGADVDNGSYGAHGTGVAGVVGGRAGNGLGTAGIAPDVTIMPLVIGSGSSVDVTLAAEAIRYAVDHGADVVNASWAGPLTGWALDDLRSAIAYAAAHDVVVVAAAGNDGADRDASPLYPAGLPEPNIVTVGSSTAADRLSADSAYGATTVDLFAPGDRVLTTWNDGSFRLVSGTSIAAPQVAAAYALYRAAWPGATAAQLKQALLDDVEPVPAFADRSVTGGRLSVGALADGALGAVRYTFTSMTAPAAGVLTPGVTATGDDATGEYSVAVGLGMDSAGEVWAVAGKELTLGGTTLTTDRSGTARFSLGTAGSPADLALSPTLDLRDGRYVLTVQLYRDGEALGRTYAAPLLVGSAGRSTPGNDSTGGSLTVVSGPPAGDVGGLSTFPRVGPFSIASMSPTRVGPSGGTRVTITGNALPVHPRVRIGDSAAATIVSSSTTSLVFLAPARTAGTYDVHVYAMDGETSVLEAALTYLDDVGAGSATGSAGSSTSGSERLVRSATFAALGGIWATDCSPSCTGVAI